MSEHSIVFAMSPHGNAVWEYWLDGDIADQEAVLIAPLLWGLCWTLLGFDERRN